MGIIKKQSTTSDTSIQTSSPTNISSSSIQQFSASFTKRKPVKQLNDGRSSVSNLDNAIARSSSFKDPISQSISKLTGPPTINIAPKEMIYSQNESSMPLVDAAGLGVRAGMAIGVPETPKTPKTFQQSQDELFSKLNALAAVKVKSNPLETHNQPRQGFRGSNQQLYNSNSRFGGSNGSNIMGSPVTSALKPHNRRSPNNGQPAIKSGAGHDSGSHPAERREPRRRINSSQFKTPMVAEVSELAQIVVANASPPKAQDKVRKRASTLSLTTTTFLPPGVQINSNNNVSAVPTGHAEGDQDYRQKYDAAFREAKHWEKKCSSIQHQLHYERDRWEEKYGALEKAYKDLENSKAEANVEKMNSLLDTVQQLQLANEVFRKQLIDAGIDPDPMPAAQFHSQHIMVGPDLDRTFLEEDEMIKEKSLVTNKKITHLSGELNNVAIAISQTINYVQLRYLTQLLDAAEHVTSQKRTRVMSNSFLSDMLSRGVKKPGMLQAKNTCTMATQTPPTILTQLQIQQQHEFQQECMQRQQLFQQRLLQLQTGSAVFKPLESKINKNFTFSSSLFNISSLNGHNNDDQVKDLHYRLKGGIHDDDRSQVKRRQPIPPVIVQNLKGEPGSPDSADFLAENRGEAPIPKFQYASPTTSQLRIVVPDDPSEKKGPSVSSGSLNGSIHNGEGSDLSLRRTNSELSLTKLQQQNGMVKSGGKYPYPLTKSNSSNSVAISTNGLSRSMSQQFLSPDMAILYSNNNSSGNLGCGNGGNSTVTNDRLSASNIVA